MNRIRIHNKDLNTMSTTYYYKVTKINLERILPLITTNFSLKKEDIELSLLGFDVPYSNYLEMNLEFYDWFNKFEATYIYNDGTQLFELFHKDKAKILHQSTYMHTESELITDLKNAKKTFDEYDDYKEHPIIRLSELERRTESGKVDGILIGTKYIPARITQKNLKKAFLK